MLTIPSTHNRDTDVESIRSIIKVKELNERYDNDRSGFYKEQVFSPLSPQGLKRYLNQEYKKGNLFVTLLVSQYSRDIYYENKIININDIISISKF